MFLSLFRPLTCTVYILNVLLMVLLVSGVYVRVHVTTQEAIITGRRLLQHLSPDVCEGTGHGRNLCKVNKFFLFHQEALQLFYFNSFQVGRSQWEPCCTGELCLLWRRR